MSEADSNNQTKGNYPTAKVVLLGAVIVIWVAFDQWSKSIFFDGTLGELYGSALSGLIDFRLVHNTGAAWGVFSGNTMALGVFSLLVCIVLLGYFFLNARVVNVVQTTGIALIAAGGIGNAIDRFIWGYVTDFIAVTFVDFPVFNVADIGVTCGVVILVIGFALAWRTETKES